MPNFQDFFGEPGGRDNGGNARMLDVLASQPLPWILTPEITWAAHVRGRDLAGPYATQTGSLEIPALGLVDGAVVLTFSGGPLEDPVEVMGLFDTDEDGTAAALEAALATARAGDLAGVLASEGSTDNIVVWRLVQGLGPINVEAEYRVAQVFDMDWGTNNLFLDGTYDITISGGGLEDPVVATITLATGTATTAVAMAALAETALEALIATTLAGVLISADDTGAVNELLFEPGIAPVTVAMTDNRSWTAVFGGTATDGNYVLNIAHDSLPVNPLPIVQPRAGGSPATNTDLGAAMDTLFGLQPLVDPLFYGETASSGTLTILGHPGISGEVEITSSAPAPGTLVVTTRATSITETSEDGPELVLSYEVELALAGLCVQGDFPEYVTRGHCALEVLEGFDLDTGGTATVGDTDEPAGILGSTPFALDTAGRFGTVAADTEVLDRHEDGFVPIMIVGALDYERDVPFETGYCVVEITWSAAPGGRID